MEDSGNKRPSSIGRLYMRTFSKSEMSSDKVEAREKKLTSFKQLLTAGTVANKGYIHSRYHGNKNAADKTSGIPIFGLPSEHERLPWSAGHRDMRLNFLERLRAGIGKRVPRLGADNSHALGSGDSGTEHALSAPPATHFQNTLQLALELAMRDAAFDLNKDNEDSLADGQSMVRVKVDDVLHDKTGELVARRIRVLRRINASIPWGEGEDENATLAVDKMMSGSRLGLTQKEAFDFYRDSYSRIRYRKSNTRPKPISPLAPTREELEGHRQAQSEAGRGSTTAKKGRAFSPIAGPGKNRGDTWRKAGPAFTDLTLPSRGHNPVEHDRDQALAEFHQRMGESNKNLDFTTAIGGIRDTRSIAENKYETALRKREQLVGIKLGIEWPENPNDVPALSAIGKRLITEKEGRGRDELLVAHNAVVMHRKSLAEILRKDDKAQAQALDDDDSEAFLNIITPLIDASSTKRTPVPNSTIGALVSQSTSNVQKDKRKATEVRRSLSKFNATLGSHVRGSPDEDLGLRSMESTDGNASPTLSPIVRRPPRSKKLSRGPSQSPSPSTATRTRSLSQSHRGDVRLAEQLGESPPASPKGQAKAKKRSPPGGAN